MVIDILIDYPFLHKKSFEVKSLVPQIGEGVMVEVWAGASGYSFCSALQQISHHIRGTLQYSLLVLSFLYEEPLPWRVFTYGSFHYITHYAGGLQVKNLEQNSVTA